MRADAMPFVVGQIRRVSPALHEAERRPPSRPPSTFQPVSRDCLKTQDRCRTEASRGYETRQRGIIFASRATKFMVEIALRLLFRQSLVLCQGSIDG